MLLALFLVVLISLGGFALTYLIARDETFLWRVCAGNVIGSAVFGTILFAAACVFGLNAATVTGTFLLTLLPLGLFADRERRAIFRHDWAKAKGKLQGTNLVKLLRFCYYAFFFVLFLFFFDRAMVENAQGIFTGASNNLGDLPFHLGAIFSFTDGMNFPPENPSFAGAKFSYPFISDIVTAAFVKLGVGVRDAMYVQNVAWAFSLLVILERFIYKLVNDRVASRLGPVLLFFSGGLGFLWFFSDYAAQSKGFIDFLWNLPGDYTIGKEFRWGNSLIVLFITQRSLLLGMPLTLVVLGKLWEIFSGESTDEPGRTGINLPALFVGILAGLLPLIHLHSLFVLFVVGAYSLLVCRHKWRDWMTFAAGVAVVAMPELLWALTGSASETGDFIAWHYGFDKKDMNIIWFWIKNTGFFIPLAAGGVWLVNELRHRGDAAEKDVKHGKKDKRHIEPVVVPHPLCLLLFYIPFVFLFILANVAKLAPWEWDNIKVLIYWFVASIPFAAVVLSWMWRKGAAWRVVTVVCILVLTLAGALDVWRTVSRQISYKAFDKDAVAVAEQIKQRTQPRALFVNAPTYNSAVVLTGRRSLMRYTGHLSSHGIDFAPRERDVRTIYRGGPAAEALIREYAVQYVVISPEEGGMEINEAFFRRYPVVAEAGQYRVYKVD
jgi:hypothetical protein